MNDSPLLWLCQDQRLLTLQQMETPHIRNSIAKIRRSCRTNDEGKLVGWRLRYLKPLVDELERRGRKDNPSLNPAGLSNRFRNLDLD